MSKEQLEELLEIHEKAVVAYEDWDFLEMRGYLETLFLEGFIDYLIEQAERFEVLSEQHDEALMQNKRYREALEFYADEATYKSAISIEAPHILYDYGSVAREALEGEV